jgi:hypothetical protein
MKWAHVMALLVAVGVANVSSVQGGDYYFKEGSPTGTFDDTNIWHNVITVPGSGANIFSYGAIVTLRQNEGIGGGTINYYGGTTTWNLAGHTLTANASSQENYMKASSVIVNGPGTFTVGSTAVNGSTGSPKSLTITGGATLQGGRLALGCGAGATLVSIANRSLLTGSAASIGTGTGPTIIKLEIGPKYATQIDVYASGGGITFGTTARLDLDLDLATGFTPSQSQTFDLMAAKGTIEGIYVAQVTLGGLALTSEDRKAWKIAVVDGSRPNEKILRATYLLAAAPAGRLIGSQTRQGERP